MDNRLTCGVSVKDYLTRPEVNRTIDLTTQKQLLDLGVTIGFDTWGMPITNPQFFLADDFERLKGLITLIDAGYADQLTIGCDFSSKIMGRTYGNYGCTLAQKQMATDPRVTFTPYIMNGVETELVMPENARTDAIIIHYHGGGFSVGNTSTSRGYASVLANETRIPVYTVSYHLAPENPYPAGADDCFAVYQAVLAKHPGLPVFFIGESAGAHFCIVTALKARDVSIQAPAGVILYSPPIEMWGILDHNHPKNKDFTINQEGVAVMGKLYFTDEDQKNDPYATPLIADYHGFPPTYVVWDESESLAVDGETLRNKLQAAGCEVTAEGYPDCFHAFATSGRGTPEGDEVLQKTVAFIQAHI